MIEEGIGQELSVALVNVVLLALWPCCRVCFSAISGSRWWPYAFGQNSRFANPRQSNWIERC